MDHPQHHVRRPLARCGRPVAAAVLAAVLVGGLLGGLPDTAHADTSQRVAFQPGTDGATVTGRLAGYDGASFVVGARAGQTLVVEMETSNPSASFNVTAPAAAEALFIGSVSGTRFEGTLPVSGDYVIEAYLMRNAARRDETADLRLRIAIPASGATPAGDVADALAGGPDWWQVANLTAGDTLNLRTGPSTGDRIRGHLAPGEVVRNGGCAMADGQRWCAVTAQAGGLSGWVNGRYLQESGGPVAAAAPVAPPGGPVAPNGQPFDATGTIPCARDSGQPTVPCAFGVQRRGAGSADVFVAFPGGGQRTISFTDGEPRAADAGAALDLGREADLWFIRIGTERYEIPDAVVTGG